MAGQGQELAPLAKEIKKKLIDRNMRQQELEATVGMPSKYLSKILMGERKGTKYLPRICQELGINLEEFRDAAYGTGTKKNSVKISLLREDFDEICDVLKSKGVKHYYDYFWPTITVSYADDGKPTRTDTISKFVPSKRSFKAAEGDKKLAVELDGIAMGGIIINGLEA